MSAAKRPASRRSPTAGNRGLGGHWIRTAKRHRIYARDGHECLWCGVRVQVGAGEVQAGALSLPPNAATLDHVIPRTHGGTNHETNLYTCCARCNAERGDTPILNWIVSRTSVCGPGGSRQPHWDAVAHWFELLYLRLEAPLPAAVAA